MTPSEVIAAIQLAQMLTALALKFKTALEQSGEWTDVEQAKWDAEIKAAREDPDFKPGL